jgi:hypothetical protein
VERRLPSLVKRARVCLVCGAVALCALVWYLILVPARSPEMDLLILVSVPALVGAVVWERRYEAALAAKAARERFTVCPFCHYPIEGVAPTCPECGQLCHPKRVAAMWAETRR